MYANECHNTSSSHNKITNKKAKNVLFKILPTVFHWLCKLVTKFLLNCMQLVNCQCN